MQNSLTKIVLSALLLAAAVLSTTTHLDEYGEEYTNQALQRTLVAFAVARGINGVISVAQGTEIALTPAGLGVTLTPGEILDPVNDLVERFSVVMLLASASIGIQKILLQMSGWNYFAWGCSLVFLLALVRLWRGYWWHKPSEQTAPQQQLAWFWRFTALLLIFRFAIPMMALVNEVTYQLFLEPSYQEATVSLEQTSEQISSINESVAANVAVDEGLLARAERLYDSVSGAIDLDKQMERYQQAAADVTRDSIRLIALFLFQAVLLPLLFLWLLIKGSRALFSLGTAPLPIA